MDTSVKNDNILLIWDRMGDYHRARWKALQNRSGAKVFAADLFASDSLYKWESTAASELFTCFSVDPATGSVNNGFFSRFKAFRKIVTEKHISTVFIPGYQHSIYLFFILYAKLAGCRVVLFAESWYRSNRLVELMKSLFLRVFVDHFFVSGKRSRNHFSRFLGISETFITTGYSVVDNDHFRKKESNNPLNNKILLCVARYAPEKNLHLLIDAFNKSALCKSWRLVLLGDGPDRASLEALVANRSNIELTGWKQYRELPQCYAQASCFILPSLFEPWGLAVNEAMAAGLPIIISDECGCAPDLLTDKNGWSLPATNLSALVDTLNMLAACSAQQLEEMGKASEEIVKNYSLAIWADKARTLHNRAN